MSHTCHWPGCGREVPPALWGCKSCWYQLPKFLRDLVWRFYRPGQEIDKNPSGKYLAVARLVQLWVEQIGNPYRLAPDERDKLSEVFRKELLKTKRFKELVAA